MDKKDTNLINNENKENIDEKLISSPIPDKNDENLFLDSNSVDNQIITELEKMDNEDKNENQNNNLSKSLSEINRNINSDEDKKNISIIKTISESREIFSYPITKQIIVEINKLSQRVSKDENENEYNNRVMVKELRSRYFPLRKVNNFFRNNYSIFREKPQNINNSNNNKFKSLSLNTKINKNININDKIDNFKKPVKPNLILDNINEIKNNLNTPNNNKKTHMNNNNINRHRLLNSENGKNYYQSMKKEENINIDKLNPITNEELLLIPNENEKILFLLNKNRELVDIVKKIEEKYKSLKEQYIALYKKSNNNDTFNYNDDSNKYKIYLSTENKNFRAKLDKYDQIFPSMVYYINDISNVFSLKKINFIELKKFLNTYDSLNNENKNETLKSINDILNENKRKIIKGNINKITNSKNKDRKLNKIRSFSNNDGYEDISKKLLTNTTNNKKKFKIYYNKS